MTTTQTKTNSPSPSSDDDCPFGLPETGAADVETEETEDTDRIEDIEAAWRDIHEKAHGKPKAKAPKAKAPTRGAGPALLTLGSDLEMARVLCDQLRAEYGDHIVSDNGTLYGWTGTHWTQVHPAYVRQLAHKFDGEIYGYSKQGPKQVRLSSTRITSVVDEAAVMVAHLARDSYFSAAEVGINCASGFVRIARDGAVTLEPHSPDHRQRHTLTATWAPTAYDGCSDDTPLPPDSLLARLFEGSFRDDDDAEEKTRLLQEIAGVAVSRMATRLKFPRAVLLVGLRAQNGKSQYIDALTGLFPQESVQSITPEKFGDDKYLCQLEDCPLNVVGELAGTAIKSDSFKQIITGDLVSARDVYRSVVRFRPSALQCWGTNKLGTFEGGFDPGVKRRLLTIPFNRVIPGEEMVENMGRRIAVEESDLLLAWAVEGARRVLARGDYEIPASCANLLGDWTRQADPFLAWLDGCGDIAYTKDPRDSAGASLLFEMFQDWALADGNQERNLPGKRQFWNRLLSVPGIDKKHSESGSVYTGIRINRLPGEAEGDDDRKVVALRRARRVDSITRRIPF